MFRRSPSAQVRGKGPRGFRAAYRRREFGKQGRAYQMCVARRMMDLGQRQAIRDHRVSELLVPVHDDVSGIEQSRFGQTGVHAPSR